MKGFTVFSALLYGLFSLALAASEPMLNWPPLQGKTGFTQLKTVQGLPVPLRSSGTLQLQDNVLLWHTTAPVEQKLKISAAGVSQWQQQDYVALAGSEFVGQLMLAVLHQDMAFIGQHFALKSGAQHCTFLQPQQAPLNQLFEQIELCGEQQLQQLILRENNGNQTLITLHAEPGAQ